MSTTAIIIILCSHIGVALTGFWLGKWWSESCSQPVINELYQLVCDHEIHEAELEIALIEKDKVYQEIVRVCKTPVLTNDDDAASTGLYTEEYHPDGSDYTVDRRIPGGHQP